MQSVLSYNESEVWHDGSKDYVRHGYNVWVDLIDPSPLELLSMQRAFHLKALEEYRNKSKKPQVRVLDNMPSHLCLT